MHAIIACLCQLYVVIVIIYFQSILLSVTPTIGTVPRLYI